MNAAAEQAWWLEWDIPSLPLSIAVRRHQFETAACRAATAGFTLDRPEGVMLAWRDEETSRLFGIHAFRAWWCSAEVASPAVLEDAANYFRAHCADFVALSSWHPSREPSGFIDAGSSVHAWVHGVKQHGPTEDAAIEIRPFGEVPEDWSQRMIGHFTATHWHDRQACDVRFDAVRVLEQRVSWLQSTLRSGDGFVVVRHGLKPVEAYLVAPIDRSRVIVGGPAIVGVGGIGGSLEEGRWHYLSVLRATYWHAMGLGYTCVLQYQTTNRAMALLVARGLEFCISTRYDLHWWAKALRP